MEGLHVNEKVIVDILTNSDKMLSAKEIHEIFTERRKSTFMNKIPKLDYFRSFIKNLESLSIIKGEPIKDKDHPNKRNYKGYAIIKKEE